MDFIPPKAIFIYAEGNKTRFTEKGTINLFLTRDFFVRQFKGLEGYIIICREGFGLYNGKRSETYILTRDFFVRQFKGLKGYIIICREGFGLYNGKRSVKKVKKAENGHYFTVQSLPSPFHIEKTYASFLTTSLPL